MNHGEKLKEYNKIFRRIRIPRKFCLYGLSDIGLTPMFYIVYVVISKANAASRDVTITVCRIMDERGKKYELRRNNLFTEVIQALSYLIDIGMITIDKPISDIGFKTELHVTVNDSMAHITTDYFDLNYNEFRKIIRSCPLKNPEYAVMLYIYIASHLYNRSDWGFQSFYESRDNTCKTLGISRYRYDIYTDYLDKTCVIRKWKSGVILNRNGYAVHVPNIYTLYRKDSINIYWQSLKDLTGISDEKLLNELVARGKERTKKT